MRLSMRLWVRKESKNKWVKEPEEDRKDRDKDSDTEAEEENNQTEMCVPDQWMYWPEWWSNPPKPPSTPLPPLSSGTDQRNKRHSALQPHTGPEGKHSVPTLTQHNDNHKCTHIQARQSTHKHPDYSTARHTLLDTSALNTHKHNKLTEQECPLNTHTNWQCTLAPTTVHYAPPAPLSCYNTSKNQIKLEQSKLRLFQPAGGWGNKSTGLCYPSMRLRKSCS